LTEDPIARPIIVFCAGDRGKYAMFALRDRGYQVIAFCDNARAKQGTVYLGLPVLSPAQLSEHSDAFVVVAVQTVATQQMIMKQLESLGVPCASIGAVVYPAVMDRIDRVHALLADDRSREVLTQVLMAHFEQNASHFLSVFEGRQYFCLDLLAKRPQGNEIFIDAGAYNGDTLAAFADECQGAFTRVISFEPTAELYAQLQASRAAVAAKWKIPETSMVTVLGGVGDRDCERSLIMKDSDVNGAGNSFYDIAERVGDAVPIYAIDSFLNGGMATFIKADIEGYELNMLKGAARTICTFKPDLAICVYHKMADIYEIPEYILSLVPDYRFYLRHHHHDYSETVLYCSIH
jgi:FkbM family methyltransferase